MPIEITTVYVSAKQLRAMPEHVRHTFLVLSHGLNELGFLHRLILAYGNGVYSTRLEKNIDFAQALFVLRLHISKLYEICQALQKSTSHWREAASRLDQTAMNIYRRINK